MKTFEGVDAKFHAFMVSLSGYERLVLSPCNYPLRKDGTQRADLRVGVTVWNRQNSLLLPESNTGSPPIHDPLFLIEENYAFFTCWVISSRTAFNRLQINVSC
jgi:hypothetical protein